MTTIPKISLMMLVVLFLNACTSSAVPKVSQNPHFQSGSYDGCATAKGEYTKNSASFNTDQFYREGWYYGRKKCNPLQAQ